MGKALKIIDKIKVVEFDWENTNEHDVGIIAEELHKIFPEAVWYKDGRIEGIRPLTMVALLVKAIQELRSKNGK